MPLTVFLSHSFQKKDSKCVDFFKRLLKECGFDVLTAKKEDSSLLLGKIYPKIDQADILVAIFNARNRMTNKKFSPPSAVVFEAGYASGQQKPVHGFCEDGVDINELGLLQHSGGNFPFFNKNKLDQKRKEFKDYICSFPVLTDRKIEGTFDFVQYVKDVTIYNNGYGVIRLRSTIQTRSEKFRSIPHMIGLGDSAKKDLKFPSFNTIRKGGPSNRWKIKPFLTFKIIDATFDESRVKLIPKKASKEEIQFIIQFPKLPVSTIFTYEWAWGCPDLYPVTKKELARGKRKKDMEYVCSVLPSIVGGYKNFVFVLRFEGTPKFIENPIINAYHSTDDLITKKDFEPQLSALYTNFVANLNIVGIQGGRIEARWIPQ